MKLSDVKLKAVVIGALVDICGSIFVGLALAIALVSIAIVSGDPSASHLAALRQGVFPRLLGLLGTTFSTAVGGYIAARVGRPQMMANSLAVGLVSLALAVTLALALPGATPTWKIIIGLAVTIPAALLGGYVATEKVQYPA